MQPSSGSRFYVLHNWRETYSLEEGLPAFPALSLSDILLKTMGILKVVPVLLQLFPSLTPDLVPHCVQEGAGWPGVTMGSLFSRPHATALFVVDGLSDGESVKCMCRGVIGMCQWRGGAGW